MFRHPRTHNEMRSYDPETLAEYGIKIRGKRKPRNLPNAWDDYYRSDALSKSWKDHRGTQYR